MLDQRTRPHRSLVVVAVVVVVVVVVVGVGVGVGVGVVVVVVVVVKRHEWSKPRGVHGAGRDSCLYPDSRSVN